MKPQPSLFVLLRRQLRILLELHSFIIEFLRQWLGTLNYVSRARDTFAVHLSNLPTLSTRIDVSHLEFCRVTMRS